MFYSEIVSIIEDRIISFNQNSEINANRNRSKQGQNQIISKARHFMSAELPLSVFQDIEVLNLLLSCQDVDYNIFNLDNSSEFSRSTEFICIRYL